MSPRKQVLLVNPEGVHTTLGSRFRYRHPPLNLQLLAALTPEEYDVATADETAGPIDLGVEADVVGVSAMTSLAGRAYQIADAFRARGVPVVLGGHHPTALPDEAIAHADAVVVGEAEGIWPQVLAEVTAGRSAGIYRAPGLTDLSRGTKLPRRDAVDLERYFPMQIIETTRGCPHDCEFCAVTTFHGGRYRLRPLDEIEEEIRWVAERPVRRGRRRWLSPFDRDMIFFADSNICANRSFILALCERLKRYGLYWQGYGTTQVANDPELLRTLREAGCVALGVGIETLDRSNLERMGKRFNKPERYEEAIRRIQDAGIGIVASFIIGLDEDDEGVFDRTAEFVNRTKLMSAWFMMPMPFPGTRLRARLVGEGRIIEENWDLYDGAHVVIRPKKMTPEQLNDGVNRLWASTLTYPSIWRRSRAARAGSFPLNLGFNLATRFLYRMNLKRQEAQHERERLRRLDGAGDGRSATPTQENGDRSPEQSPPECESAREAGRQEDERDPDRAGGRTE